MTLKKAKLIALRRSLPAAMDRAAKTTAGAAKEIRDGLVPIDTGALLESGEVLAGSRLGVWTLREGAGLPDARAKFTEFGTDKQIAQPHFFPAVEQARPLLKKNVAAEVQKIVRGGR